MLDCDPFEPSSDCVITLFEAKDGKIEVLVKSMSSDFARQGEAFEFLQSVAETLNHPPSPEFRKLLLGSIREMCERMEARKIWEQTYIGHYWLRRIKSKRYQPPSEAKKE